MLQWYVVIAKQNQDHLAARGLREQGFADVYLPKTYRKIGTVEGKRPVVSLLLSPYLFILADASRGEHGPVRNTRGVQDLLCTPAGEPEALRNGGFDLIAKLRQAEDDELCGASQTGSSTRDDLKRGMWVRIEKRHLTDMPIIGQIILLKRRKVEILVGAVVVVTDEADVSVVPAPL